MDSSIDCALYIVATPIGNLEDITLRAIDTLKKVDVIACEDTRTTSVLLNKYSITTRLVSYHKYSENARVELFLSYLKEGKSIALVSDAGTPLISDPGAVLVSAVAKEGYRVIPVVGASAVIALLSSVDRGCEEFKFVGFLPRVKNQIQKLITKNNQENLVFYESPNRLLDTLSAIYEVFPDKKIAVGRELTKKFEEIKTGAIGDIIDYYKTHTLKGEFVVMVYRADSESDIDLDEKIKKLKALKLKDKEISLIVSELFNVNKNTVYKRCLEL